MNQLFPQPASVDGYQTLFQGCALSEKVRLQTGNMTRTMNLVSVPTLGPTLAFQMNYNSMSVDATCGFGYGWTHNWNASVVPSSTAPVFIDHTGRQFTFFDDDGAWLLDLDEGIFEKITLTSLPGDEWQVSYYPDGNIFQFDSNGRMTRVLDTLGNSLELSYDLGGQIAQVEENAIGVSVGRTILFAFVGDTITITDPRSNDWVLQLDEDGNLVEVQGPEGCVTTYSYDDPEDHLITGRIDPVPRDPEEMPLVDQSWSYTFGSSGQLTGVTDSRGQSIGYAYSDSYQEHISGPELGVREYFRLTTLTDANEEDWKYVFDLAGNLRRIMNPNGHQRRFFWSPQSMLLYEASGNLNADPIYFSAGAVSYFLGIRDHANMRFRRYVYDVRGNLRQSIDGNGLITQYEVSSDRVVSVTPGRANISVQGEWEGHYGRDGHLICGATGSADVASLPAYISAVTKGTGDVEPVIASTASTNLFYRDDVRNLRYSDDGGRVNTRGYWRSDKDGSGVPYRRFQFTLEMASETNFNLSLYTCATDLVPKSILLALYNEQYGYDLEMLVTDSLGTQSFRITNNGSGCWATFPVQPGEEDVLVEIRARGNNASQPGDEELDLSVVGDAVLSALAFDPYENRTTRMGYNEVGQLTTVVDGMGNTWTKVYDETDGTLTSSLEPGQTNPTLYFYEDDYKNLTSVEDPLEGVTAFVYDENGNVTSVTDADARTTTFTLDGRNRVIQVHDALGNDSYRVYDAGGRLTQSQDQEGRITGFAYKHQRLWKITDALEQTTEMTYRASGEVETVTDARAKVTTFRYDACSQLVETEYADQAKLTYALDSLGRVTGVTSPNGNQSDLDSILLEGAKNALFNPGGQEPRPFDRATWEDPTGDLNPRYWKPNTTATREVDAEGQAYLPVNSTVNTWEQKNVPASAGCRYIARFQARKEDGSGGTTTARMEFEYRLDKDLSSTFPATSHTVLSSTLQGAAHGPTTQDWEESPRSRLDIPGDTQASLNRPAIASARIKLASGSNPLGVRNLQLQRLSTCFEFDGENLREVCFPDGARQRTEYDRLGRSFLTRDPDGRTILREFDSLDRVVHVVDSLGNELFFEYDDKMDLVLFRLVSLGVNQDTEFEWDALHRLKTITYPDTTTELFEYSAGGDLTSYTDNLSQERDYHYDELHRLDLITYPDTTTVALVYDKVGNLLSTVERDSNGWNYAYDALNRLTGQQYTGQTGLTSGYNETGQRMSLSEGSVYGLARFGANSYGSGPIWSVPSNGRDDVGRLLIVEDVNSDTTEMLYDVDGRCTQIDHENTLSDLMAYDIVGKLLSKVVAGSENLLEMRYGYSLAGDRIAQQTDLDTFTYLTDGAGRLVEESHNRFCIHQPAIWKQGEWDRLTFDAETQSMQLLPFNDDMAGTDLSLERWTLEGRQYNYNWSMDELEQVGLEMRQNDGLRVCYPRAFHNQAYFHRAPVDNSVGGVCAAYGGYYDPDGYRETLPNRPVWIDLRHADKLTGDFDISVDYQDFQGFQGGEGFGAQLAVSPSLLPDGASPVGWLCVRLRSGVYTTVTFTQTNSGYVAEKPGISVPDPGQIRMTRTGSTYEAFVRAQGASTWTSIGTYTGVTDDLYVYLSFRNSQNSGSIQFSNFQRTGDALASEGLFLSPIYDAGRVVSWDQIQWTEDLPSGCDVELEIALADDYADFEDFASPPAFFGPTGGGSFTTPAGQSLPTGKTGRYAMVRATLTGNGTDTPSLSDIQLTCNAGSDTGSRVIRTLYDEAGNILKITTTDDLGTTEDVRDDDGWSGGDRINTLNQIMRQDVGGDTWTYSWDLNGNMTGKTNGVDTWTYTWNDENRLVRVQGPGSVDVAYSYDFVGRLLTRDDGVDVTTFMWDGFDCIREQTGMSTTTYCIPEGQLLSFIRDGDRYDVHCDALLSVRMVTDENGDVVLRREFDAWGGELAGNFDNVPGGMPYGFVGAAGCRKDPATALIYMRQRWYSAELGRFISRDKLMGENRYSYAYGNPSGFVDVSGLQPTPPPPPGARITPSASAAFPGISDVTRGVANDLSPGGSLTNYPGVNGNNYRSSDLVNALNDPRNTIDYSSNPDYAGFGARTVTRGDGSSITTFYQRGKDVVDVSGPKYGPQELRNMILHEALHIVKVRKLLDRLKKLQNDRSLSGCDCRAKARNLLEGQRLFHGDVEDWNDLGMTFPAIIETNWAEQYLTDLEINDLIEKACRGKL